MTITRSFLTTLGLMVAVGFFPGLGTEARAERRPNIILILSDDQGWTGSSVQMSAQCKESRSDYFRTPNLEKLAAAGMRFSNGYAPAAVCSPTRHAIQWGKTPARVGITFNTGKVPRIDGSPSIAQLLKRVDSNYTTAHFGKWHIKIDPADAGYDETDGRTGNDDGNHKVYDDYVKKLHDLQKEVDRAAAERKTDATVADLMARSGEATAQRELAEYLARDNANVARALHALPTEKLAPTPIKPDDPKRIFSVTQRAVAFMEKQVAAQKPFYLQVSHYAVHIQIMGLEETIARYRGLPKGKYHDRPDFAAMTENLDTGVGLLLDKINELGIEDNTYVVYTSDNGAYRNFNQPLNKGKFYLHEGGIRVPLIVRGPGIAKGSFCDVPVSGIDFLPTFCDLAGGGVPLLEDVDGGSFKTLLERAGQGTITRKNPALIFHYPNFFGQPDRAKPYGERPHSAIRLENYKLIKYWDNDERLLFDLGRDIGERENLVLKMPEKAEDLHRRLMEYLQSVDAEMPSGSPKTQGASRKLNKSSKEVE